jgi:hypothetical protein
MQSKLLKYKLTVKFPAIFIQQINHEKYIKQLLLGSRSIYIEKTVQELVLNILLSTSKLMVNLLQIFQFLVCNIQSTENKSRYIYINQDLFLQAVPQSSYISNFSNMIIYSKVVSG